MADRTRTRRPSNNTKREVTDMSARQYLQSASEALSKLIDTQLPQIELWPVC